MKTSELIGPALDWAVAKIDGKKIIVCGAGKHQHLAYTPKRSALRVYEPSTNWKQGGPIIEREEIGTSRRLPCMKGEEWEARPSISAKGAGGRWGVGPTPLVAAMRCYVASRLGDEVQIPAELEGE